MAKHEEENEMGKLTRIVLVFLAAIVFCLPASIYPLTWLFFPIGILWLVDADSPDAWFGPVGMWCVYLGIVIAYFVTTNRSTCIWLFAVLCFLVALNCIGCQAMPPFLNGRPA